MRLNSFTFTNCTINKILHDSGTPQELNIMNLSRRDGAKLISSNFNVKNITIVGYVKGTSQADLETNLDTLKQNIMVTNGNLDIPYAGLYRRYIVSCSNITVSREHNHITFAPFEIRFTVCDPPFGKEISAEGGSEVLTEACSVQDVTAQRDTSSFSVGGSVSPRPIISLILDTVGNMDNIQVKNATTNKSLDIGTLWANGDTVIIDSDEFTVKRNNIDLNYDGVFPTFNLGTNNFEINLTPINSLHYENISTDYGNVFAVGGVKKRAVKIIPTSSTNYNKIELMLTSAGWTGQTVTVEVQTDSAGSPSGTKVHANATKTIDVSTSGWNRTWVSFDFTAFALTSGTSYWIVISGTAEGSFAIVSGSEALNVYKQSLDSGGTWSLLTGTPTFRYYTSITPTWHVDYNIKYNKRYL